MSSKPTLLITGVNGFIGAWVTKYALESKQYKVYGTVRDITTKDGKAKLKPLEDALGSLYTNLTLVQATLEDDESIKNA